MIKNLAESLNANRRSSQSIHVHSQCVVDGQILVYLEISQPVDHVDIGQESLILFNKEKTKVVLYLPITMMMKTVTIFFHLQNGEEAILKEHQIKLEETIGAQLDKNAMEIVSSKAEISLITYQMPFLADVIAKFNRNYPKIYMKQENLHLTIFYAEQDYFSLFLKWLQGNLLEYEIVYPIERFKNSLKSELQYIKEEKFQDIKSLGDYTNFRRALLSLENETNEIYENVQEWVVIN